VEEYLAAMQAGRPPDREAFLARHAQIAAELAECLDGLDFIRAAAPRLRESAAERAAAGALFEGLTPEAPLGDFRIVREIGRGGMGVVYEAVQISLERRVALKVLPLAAALDARQLQRFQVEARAAGGLHHANIVPVFGVGSEGGVHYYAMQYIDGQTLAQVIADLRRQTGLDRVEGSTSTGSGVCVADELVSGRWAPGRADAPSRNGPRSIHPRLLPPRRLLPRREPARVQPPRRRGRSSRRKGRSVARGTFGRWPTWGCRRRRRWSTPTGWASFTATSSRPTSCWRPLLPSPLGGDGQGVRGCACG
jgi:hypothetical protein